MEKNNRSWWLAAGVFVALSSACSGLVPTATGPAGADDAGVNGAVDAPRGGSGGAISVGPGAGGMGGSRGAAGSSGGAGKGGAPGPVRGGLGPWTGNDNVPPSQSPPAGLPPSRVPMFVTFGFDDNGYSGLEGTNGTGGMTWAANLFRGLTNPQGRGNPGTYDGTPARATFYLTATYGAMWISESNTYVKRSWHKVLEDGHEIANHTLSHNHGEQFDEAQWTKEISSCNDLLVKPFDPMEVTHTPDNTKGIGVAASNLVGFRTPFLEYNANTFTVVKKLGFHYDCSIEDGYQADHDGTNYFWPYTLDNGSSGHEVLVEWGLKKPIGKYSGLWEFPVNPFIVPPDEECPKYGIPAGLRAKLKTVASWFDVKTGKVTGFDYNVFVQYKMNKAEALATLKYTLDLRLRGNRAPFPIGSHSDYYSSKYTAGENTTFTDRQQVVEELIKYALSKPEVRVVTVKQMLDWIRNPVPLD